MAGIELDEGEDGEGALQVEEVFERLCGQENFIDARTFGDLVRNQFGATDEVSSNGGRPAAEASW